MHILPPWPSWFKSDQLWKFYFLPFKIYNVQSVVIVNFNLILFLQQCRMFLQISHQHRELHIQWFGTVIYFWCCPRGLNPNFLLSNEFFLSLPQLVVDNIFFNIIYKPFLVAFVYCDVSCHCAWFKPQKIHCLLVCIQSLRSGNWLDWWAYWIMLEIYKYNVIPHDLNELLISFVFCLYCIPLFYIRGHNLSCRYDL